MELEGDFASFPSRYTCPSGCIYIGLGSINSLLNNQNSFFFQVEFKNILSQFAPPLKKPAWSSGSLALDLLISLRCAISLLLFPNRFALSHNLTTNGGVEKTMEGPVKSSYINCKDLRKDFLHSPQMILVAELMWNAISEDWFKASQSM